MAEQVRTTVIGTGGTISSISTAAGVVARTSVADLVVRMSARFPVEVEGLDCLDRGTRASFALGLDDMLDVARVALDAAHRGPVVVTHGTDSMEETALLVDLLHDGGWPVLLTGAQRPFDDPRSDGPSNLADALACARDPRSQGRGVLVSFGGQLWPARGVRKTHTEHLEAFSVPDRAPLRLDDPVGVRSTLSGGTTVAALPPVRVVALSPGDDGQLVRAALSLGTRGMVLQALGIGNASPGSCAAVAEAVRAGIPVLVSSRVTAGPVRPVYGDGGGADLAAAGARFASGLSAAQARILLSTALARTSGPVGPVLDEWLTRRA